MGLSALTDEEKEVVFQCLRAAVDGPFFPEWEFFALFGLNRQDVARIVNTLPQVDDSEEIVSLAINNAMANLLGYPHGGTIAWRQFISVSQDEVQRIFERWKQPSSGI